MKIIWSCRRVSGTRTWRRWPSLQALVDKGVLAGVGDGKLDLSMDMLRTLVIAANMDK